MDKNFLLLADQYFRTSKNIIEEMINSDNKWVIVSDNTINWSEYDYKTKWSDFNTLLPALFLIYHGLELLLKGFLKYIKVDYEKNHNFTELLNNFQQKFLSSDSKKLILILKKYLILNHNTSTLLKKYFQKNKYIKNPQKMYNALRYPESKAKVVFDQSIFSYNEKEIIDDLSEILTDLTSVQKYSVKIFNDLESKPYNIDKSINKYKENNIMVIKKLRDRYFWIKTVHYYFLELFDKNIDQLEEYYKTANRFFHDLNIILLDYFLLELIKISDPEKTGKNYNLTIEYLYKNVDWECSTKIELSELIENIRKFRGCIKNARNKILAHFDLKTFIENKRLGSFPENEEKVFLDNIEKFLDIASREILNEPFDISVYSEGDVRDFIKLLKAAKAFDQLLIDNPEKKSEWLLKYILS
jgi:HEPN domain-containing protein